MYRKGVYRLSCGPEKSLYKALFGNNPKRALKGETVEVPFNFTEVNVIMPHPVYAWMCWVCVNSPDESTLDDFFKLVDSSYEKAKKSYNAKMKSTKKATN